MLVNPERRADKKKQVSQARSAKQDVPKCDSPTMAVPRTTRAPRAWTEWVIAYWYKILSIHGFGEAHAKHQEK